MTYEECFNLIYAIGAAEGSIVEGNVNEEITLQYLSEIRELIKKEYMRCIEGGQNARTKV